MILYHGSFVTVDKPDLMHSRPNVDFGKGFYTTPIYEQAEKWCSRFTRRGKDDKVFNTVELYFDGLIDKMEAINRLRYEKPNLQIAFRTESALSYLRFEGSKKL